MISEFRWVKIKRKSGSILLDNQQQIKDKLPGLEKNDAITISETVDMINDELMGAELKKKVVRNGLKLLNLMQEKLECEEIYELISNYCEYVEAISIP